MRDGLYDKIYKKINNQTYDLKVDSTQILKIFINLFYFKYEESSVERWIHLGKG